MTIAEQIEAEKLLSHNLSAYLGHWVAIKDHMVVADSPSLQELLKDVETTKVERIFKVPEQKGATCLF